MVVAAGGPHSSTDGPAETAGIGLGGAGSVGGVGGSDSVAGSAGALAGGAGTPSLGGSGGALPQGGAGPGGGTTVSLDLAPSLTLANETLFFPLTGKLLASSMSSPTEPNKPNELVVLYTRALCSAAHTETLVANPGGFDVGGVPTRLATVSITHDLRGQTNPEAVVGEHTCLTRRTPEGRWLPLLSPTNVIKTDSFLTLEFAVPVEPVDSVGIYLPTYTAISNIAYTIAAP